MFGKLLKYDFRSMFKQFAFVWLAALVLAIVNHFTLDVWDTSNRSGVGEMVSRFALITYIAILVAMFVVAFIIAIQRFYKGLLGDEGYLMHTLPVLPWQLVASKLLCAVVTTVISVAVALVSILMLFPWQVGDFAEIFRALGVVINNWDIQTTNVIVAMLEFCLFMLAAFAAGYLKVYLAMSIGHLANKNRVLCSVGAYIGINTVLNTLVSVLSLPFINNIAPMFNGLSGMGKYHTAIWMGIGFDLVICVVYFVPTELILRKRLNLE